MSDCASTTGCAPSPPPLSPSPTCPAAVEYNFTRASLVPLDPNHGSHRGLINQGATCYLNSFLQTMFFTPEMRHVILNWKDTTAIASGSGKNRPELNVVLQLQKLFLRMLYAHGGAVSTNALTTSFGWNNSHVWQQHDVNEFVQKLYERLMQDAQIKDSVDAINQGAMIDYVHCQTCGQKRERETPFLSLALDVKGLRSLAESFSSYIRPELLEGPNAYRCATCDSKQPAKKGVAFSKFPPILSCQLKRFDMDWNSMQRIKIASPMQISENIDLSEYLMKTDGNAAASSASSASTPSLEYELFSILIHTGSANGGHYYSYTKDMWELQRKKQEGASAEELKQCWYECNDTAVTRLSHDNIDEIFADPFSPRKNALADSSASTVDVPAAPSLDIPLAPPPPPPGPPDVPAPPPMAPSFDAPSAPPMAPPPPPGPPAPPSAPVAPIFTGAPSRAAAKQSSQFLSDFAVPEAPGMQESAAMKQANGVAQSTGPCCNAYMLVYRRVFSPEEESDRLREVDWKQLVSPHIRKELEDENQAFEAYKQMIEQEDSFVTLNVFTYKQAEPAVGADGKASPFSVSDLACTKLKLPFASSIEQLIEASLHKFREDAPLSASLVHSASGFKLRQFESKSLPLRIGDYFISSPSSELPPLSLLSLGLRNSHDVFLQPSLQDGSFPVVDIPVITLNFLRYNPQTMQNILEASKGAAVATDTEERLKEDQVQISLQVPFDVSVINLKRQLLSDKRLFHWEKADASSPIDVDRVHFVLCPQLKNEASIQDISNFASNLTPIDKILQGNHLQNIYVELFPLANNSASSSSSSPEKSFDPISQLIPYFQLQAHLITLTYNKFGSQDYDQQVTIDDRLTLGDLKKQLARALSPNEQQPLDLNSFRLRREFEHVEYKDLSRSLSLLNLKEIGSLYVDEGAPMVKGDFLFRIFRYDPSLVPAKGTQAWNDAIIIDPETNEPTNNPEELAFVYLGDLVLSESMTYQGVVDAIRAGLGPSKIPAEVFLRVRDRLENSLTNIWYADRTLKQNCPGAYDCYPLVLQFLPEEVVITSSDLLVSLRWWNPAKLELGAAQEVALNKSTNIGQVKEKIAQKFSQQHLSGSSASSDASSATPADQPASDAASFALGKDDIDVICAQPHEFREVSTIPSLNWAAKLPEGAAISAAPWRLRHGDTLLYKLRNERERIGEGVDHMNAATRALLFNLQYGSSTGAGAASSSLRGGRVGAGGPELKLFNSDEIDLREQMEIEAQIQEMIRREKQEKELKEAIQAVKDKENK